MPSRHIRYRVVAFTVALAGVTYLDRISIGVLAPSIMRDLHITQLQMGFVFAAFTLAYALFEIPTAWWADRIGSRRVLTRIVLWWSAFTMLTGAAISYPILLITRFLFGAGEAGAWPNAARVFSRWIPVNERGRVQGIFFAGAHVAGGLTPAIVAWIAIVLPWRMVFVVLGFVGLAWAYSWYRWFRDEPHEHPAVTAEEPSIPRVSPGESHKPEHNKTIRHGRTIAIHATIAGVNPPATCAPQRNTLHASTLIDRNPARENARAALGHAHFSGYQQDRIADGRRP